MACQNAQEWLYKIFSVYLYLEGIEEGRRKIDD